MKQLFHKRIPALLAAFALALAFSVQTLAAGRTLVPGGYTVGIKLYMEGLMVTEVEDGAPAQRAGLKKGDVIVSAGETKTDSAQTLLDTVQTPEPVVLRIERGGREAEFLVTPERTADGYRLGILVRDHIAGIGTVTYYDPSDGSYGALGHGVSGLDGTQLLMMQSGYLVRSSVAEVRTGTRGAPGELHGIFDVTDAVGTVEKHTSCGIFGTLAQPAPGIAVETASRSQITVGPAEILSNVEGEQVQRFSIRIDRIDPGAKNGRNLLITVTDEALLAKTGGIVQGMSGSPILQNGRLVGAVTHVLVNDPTSGYGIFIENMLDAAG